MSYDLNINIYSNNTNNNSHYSIKNNNNYYNLLENSNDNINKKKNQYKKINNFGKNKNVNIQSKEKLNINGNNDSKIKKEDANNNKLGIRKYNNEISNTNNNQLSANDLIKKRIFFKNRGVFNMCFKEQNFNLNKKRTHSYCKYNKSLNNNHKFELVSNFYFYIFLFTKKIIFININKYRI